MKEIDESYKKAVVDYRDAVHNSFYSRRGEEPNKNDLRNVVIDLFKKSPEDSKISLLYFTLKTLVKPVKGSGYDHLNIWLQELAVNLTDELENL